MGSLRRYGPGQLIEVERLRAVGAIEPKTAKQKHDLIVFDRSQRSLRQPGDRPEAPLASLGLTRPPPVALRAQPQRPRAVGLSGRYSSAHIATASQLGRSPQLLNVPA